MQLLADYHVHSDFSADSTASMESMVKQAIHLGLKHLCFTDHMDYDFPKQYLENGKEFEFDVDAYFKKIRKLQLTYKDQISIHAGIELGIKPEIVPRLEKLVDTFPFDFVIASSHLLHNFDPYYPDYWNHIQNNAEKGIRDYFQSIKENVAVFSNFDVYGHLDYIVRYIPDKTYKYHPEQFAEEIDDLLSIIIQKGRGIEVNTAGLKYGLPFAHPEKSILKRYFTLGGTYYTIGSDAHKPEHLAYDFKKEGTRLSSLHLPEPSIFIDRVKHSATLL